MKNKIIRDSKISNIIKYNYNRIVTKDWAKYWEARSIKELHYTEQLAIRISIISEK
jgi:hypothetical protein